MEGNINQSGCRRRARRDDKAAIHARVVSPFARLLSKARKRSYDNAGLAKNFFARFSRHFERFRRLSCAIVSTIAHD